MVFFFFFKQKTAYDMCISDWSSDVCSSDLLELFIETASGAELERLTTVILEQGDVIVMRGDMIHAGAASPDGHFARVHAYLDIPEVSRKANSTDRKTGVVRGEDRKSVV